MARLKKGSSQSDTFAIKKKKVNEDILNSDK